MNFNDDHRFTEAVAPFRQALAIFQEIDRRSPTDDSARNIALCEKRLAALSLQADDPAAALLGYQAARAVDERLVARDPQSLLARSDLTYDLSDLGTTLRRLTRWSEASDVYDRAIVLRRQAYEQDKNDAHARRSLAAILYRQGSLLHYNLKKPEAALGPLREASQLWSLDDPVDAQRGETEYELGVACTQLGNLREAEVHRATALAIFTTAAKTGSLESNQKAMFDDLRGPSKDAVAPAARAVR